MSCEWDLGIGGGLVAKLCLTLATPWTVACKAPLSMRFPRQEHWSGLPFPSPMHEMKSESEIAQSCLTLCDPIDCSLPGSSVHGIFQARVLEWGAILIHEDWKMPIPSLGDQIQESNRGLLYCRWILDHSLSHLGSLK